MSWNQDKSVKLSKFCVHLFMVIYVAVIFTAPWLFRLLIQVRGDDMKTLPLFLITIYLAAVPAAGALWDLRRLLFNISGDAVFIPQNVAILRRLSWYCIAAGLICLPGVFFYPVFLIVSSAAAFVGLILRVVKNVFAQAVQIKTENDFTI